MKKVLTFGVFDYFHIGHLNLFERAKALGDYLIVAVQDGEFILKFKPNANILYTTEERLRLVGALRTVDEVVVYQEVDKSISQIDFDVLVVSEEHTHAAFQRAFKWCEENGKEIVSLKRTPGISSSLIKQQIEEMS